MPQPRKRKSKSVVARRPTEVVSGAGGAAVVYGYLTQVGLPPLAAAIIAVVAGFVPAIVTGVNDLLHK
jgi:ABC-type uncharacterized transport system permease subunit